jgi:hypothetical protein
MPARILRMIVLPLFAAAAARLPSPPASRATRRRPFRGRPAIPDPTRSRQPGGRKQNAVRTQAADRDAYVDPAAPYKANRLSSPRATEPILNIPGQTTVLTREVLDDMKATSVRDALRSTAGVRSEDKGAVCRRSPSRSSPQLGSEVKICRRTLAVPRSAAVGCRAQRVWIRLRSIVRSLLSPVCRTRWIELRRFERDCTRSSSSA